MGDKCVGICGKDDLQSQPVENIDVQVAETEMSGTTSAALLVLQVKDFVSKSGPDVRSKVIKHLVDKQIEERANLILKGLDKRTALTKDLQKCKPDQKTRTGDGKVEERFSEQKWKEKDDLIDELKKLDKALEDAFSDKANYEPLKKAVS